MILSICLSFLAISGLGMFLAGMLNMPSIGGASTGVSTYSLPPKPSTTATLAPYASPIGSPLATPVATPLPTPVATPIATPIAISGLTEVSPPDSMAIIIGSNGFKLVVAGAGLFIVSLLIRICYRRDEEVPRRIVPYRPPVLKEIIVKPREIAIPIVTSAIIHELKPPPRTQVQLPTQVQAQAQVQLQAKPLPQVQSPPYPPRGPVFYRTFKYPPPYDAFNKK